MVLGWDVDLNMQWLFVEGGKSKCQTGTRYSCCPAVIWTDSIYLCKVDISLRPLHPHPLHPHPLHTRMCMNQAIDLRPPHLLMSITQQMNVRFNIQMLLEPEPSLHSYVFLVKMEGGPFLADSLDISSQKGISKLSSSNTFRRARSRRRI